MGIDVDRILILICGGLGWCLFALLEECGRKLLLCADGVLMVACAMLH